MGPGDDRLALDILDGDVGGPALFFRALAWLECGSVLAAPFEDRVRSCISWKRREPEGSLPEDRKVCGRCRVAFTVTADSWNRDGFCSKSCHRAFLMSWAKPG